LTSTIVGRLLETLIVFYWERSSCNLL